MKRFIVFLIMALFFIAVYTIPAIIIQRGQTGLIEETNTEIAKKPEIFTLQHLQNVNIMNIGKWYLWMEFTDRNVKYKLNEKYDTFQEAVERAKEICPTCYE